MKSEILYSAGIHFLYDVFYRMFRIFPQNDTNATLKCPSESSLHRPSLFNCAESRHLTFPTKNKKAAYLNFIHL